MTGNFSEGMAVKLLDNIIIDQLHNEDKHAQLGQKQQKEDNRNANVAIAQ